MRVFKSDIIRQLLTAEELAQLEQDFMQYKATGFAPDTFGRDEPFDHPHTLPLIKFEDLRHIHLAPEGQTFPLSKLQFFRTSDAHLIYCQGFFNADHFLLITVLAPNAHDLEKSNDIMYRLGKVAESFRQKH
jgi:mRNA interferase YafO